MLTGYSVRSKQHLFPWLFRLQQQRQHLRSLYTSYQLIQAALTSSGRKEKVVGSTVCVENSVGIALALCLYFEKVVMRNPILWTIMVAVLLTAPAAAFTAQKQEKTSPSAAPFKKAPPSPAAPAYAFAPAQASTDNTSVAHEEDVEIGYATAIISCAISLALGFGLGYGT